MTGWVVDRSALVRLSSSPDRDTWTARIERGLVRLTSVTLLEVGYSARSVQDLRQRTSRPPLEPMPVEHLRPLAEDRALIVQELLAERGHHRAQSAPDLHWAAAAEVTGQAMERLRVA